MNLTTYTSSEIVGTSLRPGVYFLRLIAESPDMFQSIKLVKME